MDITNNLVLNNKWYELRLHFLQKKKKNNHSVKSNGASELTEREKRREIQSHDCRI